MKKSLAIIAIISLCLVRVTAAHADTGTGAATTTVAGLSMIDTDHDGLTDAEENKIGTDPNNPDTDGDGFKDGSEVYNGFDPLIGGRARAKNKHVVVDLSTQTLAYYVGDAKLGIIPISSGILSLKTPTGTFTFFKKVPVKDYKGANYDLPNTKWNVEFLPGYYVHGAYWHNQFGIRPMSHGCINVGYKDMEPLYQFLDVGDSITIIGKTPTKPLAKK